MIMAGSTSTEINIEIPANEDPAELSWYSKVFEYLKNRNRIGPSRVEFPDCDFFIVGPSRTLRILRPCQKSSEFYEINNDRPESVTENFISKWAKRPHSLNTCRCSFRQSSFRLSTEDCLISAEINRIRTSLCEAEKTGQDIEDLEKKISVNLNCLNVPITVEPNKNHANERLAEIANVRTASGDPDVDDVAIKNKIVKDLEKYIDELLQEVLNDTMKFMSDTDNTLRKSRQVLHENSTTKPQQVYQIDEPTKSPLKISFAFPEDHEKHINIINQSDTNGSYVNEGFIGSAHDPDCVDFNLQKPTHLDKFECIDSGINSVETMEFQTDPGLSLEQSLMQIIDAKFGRGTLSKSWEDLNREDNHENNINHEVETTENTDFNLITKQNKEIAYDDNGINEMTDIKAADDDLTIILDEPIITNKFGQLRLELTDDPEESSLNIPTKKINTVANLCEKFSSKIGNGFKSRETKSNCEKVKKSAEMRDYRATWKGCEESDAIVEELPKDLVVFRRNRKPFIVFIHGFGSSADVFDHQLRYFSQMGYPCIAPDILGHGMSSSPSKSRDYRFDKLLNDLEAILHHYAFRPGQKCVLVGHNYGCSFATALASKYESEIHQLVLISGGGPTPLAPPSTEGPGHCCLRAMLSPLLVCGLHRDILYSARGRQHPYCGSEPENQWPSHMKYVLNGMIWPEGDYVFHRRITTPTLLIHGLRDNKVSLVQECQMERTIVKAFLEAIPTAGHIPMIETPDQVNHMIHCFTDLWKKKKR